MGSLAPSHCLAWDVISFAIQDLRTSWETWWMMRGYFGHAKRNPRINNGDDRKYFSINGLPSLLLASPKTAHALWSIDGSTEHSWIFPGVIRRKFAARAKQRVSSNWNRRTQNPRHRLIQSLFLVLWARLALT